MKLSHAAQAAFLACIVLTHNTYAAVIDDNAAVVKLRHVSHGGCVEGGEQLHNCFSNMGSLENWLHNVRIPTAASPVKIEIGPGQFGRFLCNGLSNLSLVGSGPDQTRLTNGGIGIEATGCFNLHVQDIKITGGFIPVYWHGTGSSTWTNVHVVGGLYAWSETCSGVTHGQEATHKWFSSRLFGTAKTYLASCSKNWFFGSEIIASGNGLLASLKAFTVFANDATPDLVPELHVYGSSIKSIAVPGATYAIPAGGGEGSGLVAVNAGRNAKVHIHGTGIDVFGNDVENDIASLVAAQGAMIHATSSSFVIHNPTGGAKIRLLNVGGHIHAPYLWEEHPVPPDVLSVTGADMAVVTDGSQPSLVIYSDNCASKWFDVASNSCRP